MRHKFRWNRETKSFDEFVKVHRTEPFEAPFIRPDSMPMAIDASGKPTESWSHWKRVGKQYGDVVHISEQQQDDPSKRFTGMTDADYEASARMSMEQLRYGTYDDHFTEYDREMCKRVNERIRNKA